MNKTSITTLYLYVFLFTLSVWLWDITFTADRSCTLVGCDTCMLLVGNMLFRGYKLIHDTNLSNQNGLYISTSVKITCSGLCKFKAISIPFKQLIYNARIRSP